MGVKRDTDRQTVIQKMRNSKKVNAYVEETEMQRKTDGQIERERHIDRLTN